MAWVERRVTRTTQPQDGVGVDRSNPITRGLVSAWLPHIMPVGATYSSAPAYEPMPLGNSRLFDGKFVETGQTLGNAVTLIALISVKTFNVDSSLANTNTATTSQNGIVIWFSNSTLGLQIRQNVDAPLHNLSISATNLSSPSVIAAKWEKGSYASLFLNGRGVTSSSATSWTDSFPLRLFAGNRDSYWRNANIRSGMYAVFDRALSDAEIKSLSENPWQIFEPEVERIWISDYVTTGGITQVQSDASLNYVLQAITFQSQGGMYSILGLVNADINSSYYVNEARVNSSSASYVVLGAVTQSQNEEYNVLASLSNTQGSTYNVRSALSQDQGSTYFISESTYREQLVDYVIRSAQFNDQGGTYNILSANTVGNNASLNYVISALIQQDQQENYLVRSSLHQETNGIYTVRASAENSTESSYIVRGSLSSEAQLDYTVRAEVNSEGTLSYTIRASLSKDQGLMYDILAANNVSSSSGGSYIIQATTANNTSCSYQIQGEVIDVPLTNAEMQQLYAWVSELVTKSATKEEIATAVWSKPTSELTVENSIGKWLMQKVLTVSKFLALK